MHLALQFGLGGAVKPGEEEGDSITDLTTTVFIEQVRPGFARIAKLGNLFLVWTNVWVLKKKFVFFLFLGS